MDITLLGTSAADGWPALFCRCAACGKARKLRGKNLRTRTTTLIDGVLKIDFPPDTLHHVIQHNLDLSCLRALLFTHAHDDHFGISELQYLGPYFVKPKREHPMPVYGPPNVIEALEKRYCGTSVLLDLHVLTPWKTARVAGYRVTPLLAQHDPAMVCFNYLIEDAEGTVLLYASDTGWYETPTWDFLESARINGMIIECAKGPQEGGYAGHLAIPEVIAMRQRLIESGSFSANGPVVTTHHSHLGGLMHHELEAKFAPYHIEPGYDGMKFVVSR